MCEQVFSFRETQLLKVHFDQHGQIKTGFVPVHVSEQNHSSDPLKPVTHRETIRDYYHYRLTCQLFTTTKNGEKFSK